MTLWHGYPNAVHVCHPPKCGLDTGDGRLVTPRKTVGSLLRIAASCRELHLGLAVEISKIFLRSNANICNFKQVRMSLKCPTHQPIRLYN